MLNWNRVCIKGKSTIWIPDAHELEPGPHQREKQDPVAELELCPHQREKQDLDSRFS